MLWRHNCYHSCRDLRDLDTRYLNDLDPAQKENARYHGNGIYMHIKAGKLLDSSQMRIAGYNYSTYTPQRRGISIADHVCLCVDAYIFILSYAY